MIFCNLEPKFTEQFICSRVLCERHFVLTDENPTDPDIVYIELGTTYSNDWVIWAKFYKGGCSFMSTLLLASGKGGTRILAQNAGWPVFEFWKNFFNDADDPRAAYWFIKDQEVNAVSGKPSVVDVLT